MLGRVLFAVVCLVITTGLLLPIYPAEVAAPALEDMQDLLVVDTGTPMCGDCASAASTGVGCAGGGQALLRAAARAKACLHLTVYLVVQPLPVPGRPAGPQLLPPKLPTI